MITHPYIKIFDADFTYNRASRRTGNYPDLQTFLRLATAINGHDWENRTYPLQTAYYRYNKNIAVLFEQEDVYYCQTIVNGQAQEMYRLPEEADKLKAFFDGGKDEITVLENNLEFELPSDYDIVIKFVKCVTDSRNASKQYHEEIFGLANRLREIQKDVDDVINCNQKSTYKSAIDLTNQCLVTLHMLVTDMKSHDLLYATKCPIDDGKDLCRIFGLFVIALKCGTDKYRYHSRRRHMLTTSFKEMLKEMHLFLHTHPNIEKEYCEYMSLPLSERNELHALLDNEGLYNDDFGCIGNDIF